MLFNVKDPRPKLSNNNPRKAQNLSHIHEAKIIYPTHKEYRRYLDLILMMSQNASKPTYKSSYRYTLLLY